MAWFDDVQLPGSTISGSFGFIREDGIDPDTHPDVRLATGAVTFTPTVTAVRAGGAWLGISPIRARIFEGELVVSEEDPRPVRILSTDADTGVAGWGWIAKFDVTGASIKPIRFLAPATGVHLTGDGLIPITGAPVEVVSGAPGPSAYDVAVANGYTGTESEWLESLHGNGSAWDAITGKPDIVVAEDLAPLTARMTTVEARTTAVEGTVDKIKLANVSYGTGAPSGSAPVGWHYQDTATGDIYRMEA